MLLLDTCTILWLSSDQDRLSERARAAMVESSDALFVSAISAFEVAVKCRSGKLELPLPPATWYAKVLENHGLVELPLSGEIAAEAALLPMLHRDPCDRFIVATAARAAMSIVTSDHLIAQYPQARVVW